MMAKKKAKELVRLFGKSDAMQYAQTQMNAEASPSYTMFWREVATELLGV